jgi:predicted SprT family Zn-dependent metalloprotease
MGMEKKRLKHRAENFGWMLSSLLASRYNRMIAASIPDEVTALLS